VALQYDDFDLQITPLAGGKYRVHVNAPSGQTSGDFLLPFTDIDFGNFLGRIGQVRRSTRRSDGPELNAAKDFGGKLFNAVFSGEMIAQLRSSVEQSLDRDHGLRIRLRLTDAPELADLPWEFLYDAAQNHFLTTSIETPVVRFLDLPQKITPLRVSLPLRVLVMIAGPRNLKRLDAEGEWARLQDGLGDLLRSGQIVLERMPAATLSALRLRARGAPFHVFHFIGHGGFDQQAEDGVLQFEDENGMSYPVRGELLGMQLHDHRSLRLAVLNACEGARSSRRDPFSGVAQSLLQQRVPAVIAMQFEISDAAAKIFAREFYCAIAEGNPVDAAVCESRKALFNEEFGQEWATPVLYMRSQEGTLFELAPAGTFPPEPPRAGSGEHIVAEAARKATEFAEATRVAEAAAALAQRQREEEERIALARMEEAQAEHARIEQARIESEKAAATEVERKRVETERIAAAERDKREAALRAQAVARVEREDKERAERESAARQNAAAGAVAAETATAAHGSVGASTRGSEAGAGASRKFPVSQIGAGVVILGLLFALSWHHLRPHSHSEEENPAGVASPTPGSGPGLGSAATVPAPPQNSRGANEAGDGAGSSSDGASLSAGSGSGDKGAADATGSGARAKRGDGVRAKNTRDGKTESGDGGATISSTGSGASSSASTRPAINKDAAGGTSTGMSATSPDAAPLRVNPTTQEAMLVLRVSPIYPPQAIQNHVSGMVVLDVVIAKDGAVKNVAVTSGNPMLAASAVDAVKQRKYQVTLVNGKPVEVETTVSINFSIKDTPSAATNSGVTSTAGSQGAGAAANPSGQPAPCTLGTVVFKENGTMIIGTVPYAYSGGAKLQTIAVVGFPLGADKKRITGVSLAETTLPAAIGTASFSMESKPSLSGGGAMGEFVEVAVVVKSTGEALCGKLVPYLRNW
jgi:TonB family protein